MSNHNFTEAVAAVLFEVALAGDGAVIGIVLAAVAVTSLVKFVSSSSTLANVQNAPSVTVSDLRSLISNGEEKLVIVRGEVETKSSVDGSIRRRDDGLISRESREKGVVLQRTQTVSWSFDASEAFKFTCSVVPFVLAKHRGLLATPDYVTVGIVEEEKIIPVGNVITALGSCSSKNGILEIKSCKDFPFFLSEMTKAQMVGELDYKTKTFFWSGVIIGSLSIGILGFSAIRNWDKFKAWRQQRRAQRQPPPTLDDLEVIPAIEDAIEEEDLREIPYGELCVICLMRRKRSAFVPCGHLVCCQRCALSVERKPTPLCPVCRQAIQKSLIIFGR